MPSGFAPKKGKKRKKKGGGILLALLGLTARQDFTLTSKTESEAYSVENSSLECQSIIVILYFLFLSNLLFYSTRAIICLYFVLIIFRRYANESVFVKINKP